MVLVHGLGGSGKSSLLRQFRLLADGTLPDSPVPAGRLRTVWLDWEDEQRDQPGRYASVTGPVLVTVLDAVQRAVLSALAEDRRAAVRADHAFGAYRQGAARMPEYAARFAQVFAQSRQAGSPFTSQDAAALARSAAGAGLLAVGHPGGFGALTPDQLAATGQAAGHLSEAAAQAVTGKKRAEISAEEYDLVTDPARELTRRLAAALRDIAAGTPLVVLLDTGEVIGDRAWAWLRRVMTLTGPRLIWVVGARFETEAEAGFDSPVAQFVREIGSDHLVLMLTTRFDDAMIGDYLQNRVGKKYGIEQIDMIARFTRGLPLAVSLTATLLEQGQHVADVCRDADGGHPGSIVSRLARRYLVHAEKQDYPPGDPRRDDLTRILGLALAYGDLRADPGILATLWAIPEQQVLPAFQDLARRHDFVLPMSFRLHDDVRDTLRADLLNPYRRTQVREINQRAAAMFTTRLAEMRDRWPTLDDQVGHAGFTTALLSALWHTSWKDNQDGLDLFIAVLPVLEVADPATADAAAALVGHLAGTFDQDQRRDLDLLTSTQPARWAPDLADPRGSALVPVRRVMPTLRGLALPWPESALTKVAVGQMTDRQAAVLIMRAAWYASDRRDDEALETLRMAAAQTSSARLREAIGWVAGAISGSLPWGGPEDAPVPTATGLAAAKLAAEMLQDSEPVREYAAALYDRGEFADALAAYDQAITLDPHNALMHNDRGIALADLGRHGEALAAYDQAITLDPGNADMYNNRGIALADLGRHADALAAYDQAITLDPGNAVMHSNRGKALADLGRHADALAAFDQAITLEPGNADMHNNRGIALADLGRHADALAAFDQAITLDPGNALMHNDRGNELAALGRQTDALAAYDQAITLDPGNAVLHSSRADALVDLGRHAEALAAYDQAIAVDPGYAVAHNNRGFTLADLGRHAEALAAYDQAITVDPGYAVAHSNRGNALAALGRHADALAAYNQAITLNPRYAKAHKNRGILLVRMRDLDGALAELDSAEHLAPNEVGQGITWAAAILWHKGDAAAARERFARVKGHVTRCTPFRTAEMEAVALCGLGEPAEAAQRLLAASPQRLPGDRVDHRELYDLLSVPPLPGVDRLRAIVDSDN